LRNLPAGNQKYRKGWTTTMDNNFKGVIAAMIFSMLTSVAIGYMVIKVSMAEQAVAITALKEKVDKNDLTMGTLNSTLVDLQITIGRLGVIIEEDRRVHWKQPYQQTQ